VSYMSVAKEVMARIETYDSAQTDIHAPTTAAEVAAP